MSNAQPDFKYDWVDPLDQEGLEHIFARMDSAPSSHQPQINAPDLIAKLHQSYQLLQNANYRIGYLEAQMDSLKQQVALVENLLQETSHLDELCLAVKDLEQVYATTASDAARAEEITKENAELQLSIIRGGKGHDLTELMTGTQSSSPKKSYAGVTYYDLIRKSIGK